MDRKNKDKQYFLPLKQEYDISKLIDEIEDNFGLLIEGSSYEMCRSIINIACDYLAKGKNVLITSKDYTYLENVENNLPCHLKPLSIRKTSECDKNFDNMESSIKAMVDTISKDNNIIIGEIYELKHRLKKENNVYDNLYKEISEIKKIQNSVIKYEDQRLNLRQLAKWVEVNQYHYGWIDDAIDLEEEAPMTDAKFSKLIYMLSNVENNDLYEFNKCKEILKCIPNTKEILDKINRFNVLSRQYQEFEKAILSWNINENEIYDYKKLLKDISAIKNYLWSIKGKWVSNILIECYKDSKKSDILQEFIFKVNFSIKRIKTLKNIISKHTFSTPDDMKVKIVFEETSKAIQQYKNKGKINKFYIAVHNKYHHIVENSNVDDIKIENLEYLELLNYYLEKQIIESELVKLWNENEEYYGYGKVEDLNEVILDKINMSIIKLDESLRFLIFVEKFKKSIQDIEIGEESDWIDFKFYDILYKGFFALDRMREYNDLNRYIANLTNIISNYVPLKEIAKKLRNSNLKEIGEAYGKVERFKLQESNYEKINRLIRPLQNRYPLLTKKIICDEDRTTMLDRYKNFSKAWVWKKFYDFLKKNHGFNIRALEEQLIDQKNKINDIASMLIWKNITYNQILKNCDKDLSVILKWFEMFKNSKLNDENYILNRNELRMQMKKCYQFVPLWVMSLSDVADNMPLEKELFDLIIIVNKNSIKDKNNSILLRGKKNIIFQENYEFDNSKITTEKMFKDIEEYEINQGIA